MTRPLIALVVEPGSGRALRPFVRALAHAADVRALGRCPRRPDARLVVGAGDTERGQGDGSTPVARVVDGAVLVGGERMLLPVAGVDVDALAPRGVLVRARWRERFGQPDDWVVVGERISAASLAVAAAAIVDGDDLPLAAALGTPMVVDRSTATRFDLTDGHEVVVSDAGADAAARLAADPVRAAALGAAARSFAERSLDWGATARRTLLALGLADPAPMGGLDTLDQRLTELRTPAAAPIRRRVADATAILSGVAP